MNSKIYLVRLHLSYFLINNQNSISNNKVKKIPILPNVVGITDVKEYITNINEVPIGIDKKELEIVNIDYLSNLGNIITSTKLDNTKNFVKSLLHIFKTIPNNNLIVIDSQKQLGLSKDEYHNYYTENLDNVLLKIKNKLNKLPQDIEVFGYIPTFISIVEYYITNKKTNLSLEFILSIISTIVYIVSPIDIVPDLIPGIGYLDEAYIILKCLDAYEKEFTNFIM